MQNHPAMTPLAHIEVSHSASLMVDAYRGTVDWQEGDDQDVAKAELEKVFANNYGLFLESASLCIVDDADKPLAQIACSLIDSEPTILFVYTASKFKRQGLAERLIRQAAFELHRLGYETVSLYVTHQNPALNLYERLGFEQN
jgi:ribosomal protein S18 acetylase RimI-like enzyme